MNEKVKGSAYSEKLKALLEKNKQIVKDLEAGKLTTQEAADRVESISLELKNLTAPGAEGRAKALPAANS